MAEKKEGRDQEDIVRKIINEKEGRKDNTSL